jgi:hypothetical protein
VRNGSAITKLKISDGGVMHGPTNYAERRYDARVRNGKVKLKLSDA